MFSFFFKTRLFLSSHYFCFFPYFIAAAQSLIFATLHALFISLHVNGPLAFMFMGKKEYIL